MFAGEPGTMQFGFVNTYPHRDVPSVVVRYAVVRYYVTPIRELGQKDTPAGDDYAR